MLNKASLDPVISKKGGAVTKNLKSIRISKCQYSNPCSFACRCLFWTIQVPPGGTCNGTNVTKKIEAKYLTNSFDHLAVSVYSICNFRNNYSNSKNYQKINDVPYPLEFC
jgi:hypothetical protein